MLVLFIDATAFEQGMSIIQAANIDEALEMVEGHHHLHRAEDCTITILEKMGIPEDQMQQA